MINGISNPQELFSFMKSNIRYGFVSKDGKKYIRKEVEESIYMDNIIRNYYFQKPEEVLISKCGICYDQVALAKKFLLDNNYKVYTFYTRIHNHVFLVYEDNNKYYYFERSFPNHNGIFSFNNLEELFRYYISIQNDLINEISFYSYDDVIYGCDFYDFINNIIKNDDIKMVLKRN